MKRHARLSRRIRLRKKNPERAARRHQVQYGGPEYREFLLGLRCVPCGKPASEMSHTEAGGMGMKAPWYTIVPQCHACHELMHQRGAASFLWTFWGLTVRWLREQARCYAEEYIRIFGAPPPGAPDLPERNDDGR